MHHLYESSFFQTSSESSSGETTRRTNSPRTPTSTKERPTKNDTYVVLKKMASSPKPPRKADENRVPGRKGCKRIRSPGIEEKNGPVSKKVRQVGTPVVEKEEDSGNSRPSSARKVLEGIGKGLNRARSALTPRLMSMPNPQPVVLCGKNLCNVSSTASTDPDTVLSQLRDALNLKGITCTQKGYVCQKEDEVLPSGI